MITEGLGLSGESKRASRLVSESMEFSEGASEGGVGVCRTWVFLQGALGMDRETTWTSRRLVGGRA